MDTGTTAFMLCCIIGLTIMIPGLALFYGGMVSVQSSTNMMMMTFGAVAVVDLEALHHVRDALVAEAAHQLVF